MLDKQGKVESTSVIVMRVSAKDGKTERTVVSATMDGQDETAKVKAKLEGAKDDKDDDAQARLPVRREGADEGQVHRVGPVAPSPRRAVASSLDREGARSGTNVDPATGDVATVSFTPAKLPTLADRVTITMLFGASRCRPGSCRRSLMRTGSSVL